MEFLNTINNYSLALRNKRAEDVWGCIVPLFEGSENFLDIGCGTAHLGYLISKLTNRHVEYLDVKKAPFTHPEANVKIYDGKTIPYCDNYFETSMAIFTLHHTQNAVDVLKEMLRVTYRNIIVVEDFLKSRNFIDLASIVLKDLVTNFFYTRLTFQYRTVPEWKQIFKTLNLKIKKEIYFGSNSFLNLKHVGWLLEF